MKYFERTFTLENNLINTIEVRDIVKHQNYKSNPMQLNRKLLFFVLWETRVAENDCRSTTIYLKLDNKEHHNR